MVERSVSIIYCYKTWIPFVIGLSKPESTLHSLTALRTQFPLSTMFTYTICTVVMLTTIFRTFKCVDLHHLWSSVVCVVAIHTLLVIIAVTVLLTLVEIAWIIRIILDVCIEEANKIASTRDNISCDFQCRNFGISGKCLFVFRVNYVVQ